MIRKVDHKRVPTSTIFDLRNGFLMYHVEVSQVRTQVINSTFPVSSMLSGATLGGGSEKAFSITAMTKRLTD